VDKEGNEFDVTKKLYKEPEKILTTSEDGGRLKGQRL
jgi:hypothetical protein